MEKRSRTSSPVDSLESDLKKARMSPPPPEVDHMTEQRAGMTEYINPSLPAFSGIIKQRFTDFMVNEITPLPAASVCRITSLDPPPGKYLSELKRLRGEADEDAAATKQKQEEQSALDAKRQALQDDSCPTWPETADEKLAPFFDSAGLDALKKMWTDGKAKLEGKDKDERRATTRPLASKEERTNTHALIRDLFGGRLASESTTLQSAEDDEDARANAGTAPPPQTAISVKWATRSDRRGKEFLDEEAINSPPYIHFLLQKTNRDHQEAMVLLAQSLGMMGGQRGPKGPGTKDLSIAGTKDKRGVTVQRVSLKRGKKTMSEVWRLVNGVGESGGGGRGRGRGGRGGGGSRGKSVLQALQNRGDKGLRIAHMQYASEPLKLSQLSGNEFTIALRNVKVPSDDETVIHRAMATIKEKGFINYYGMQRFGTGAVPTHEFGILIFKGEYQRAIEVLMQERTNDNEDLRAAKRFYAEGKFEDAWQLTPRSAVAEKAVLDKMRRKNYAEGDWLGAFANVPRTLRLMYIHAFQSYVWNRLVSARVQKFGADKPAAGDVVLLGDEAEDAAVDGADDGDDDDDQAAPVPVWSRATKVLTETDLSSYTIHDVVMPLPGSDISLPTGWMSEMYTTLLAESGLTPMDLTSHKQKEYELKGSYRKMIQTAKDFSYELVRYRDPDVALTVADEDRCLGLKPESDATEGEEFLALKLNFKLPASAYATMLMREALKSDTSSFKHRQMTQRSEDQKFKTQRHQAQGGRNDVNSIVPQKARTWGTK